MSGSMYQYMKNDGIIKGFLQQTKQGIVKETDDVGFVDVVIFDYRNSYIKLLCVFITRLYFFSVLHKF